MGFFITFEGPEGSGKSTQARLLAEWLRDRGVDVLLTREPGGTPVGDRIRSILLDPRLDHLSPEAEVLLFSASRAQHVRTLIRPALEAGRVVICDRYADSTYAYQGYGRGLPLEDLQAITRFATGGLKPDLTLLIDVPVEIGLRRKRGGSGKDDWNRMEQERLAYHRRVREGYLKLAEQEPQRWVVLDGRTPLHELQEHIRALITQRLPLNLPPHP